MSRRDREPGPHPSGTVSPTRLPRCEADTGRCGRDERLGRHLAQGGGLVARGAAQSSPETPSPRPPAPSFRAFCIPWTCLCSSLDAAAHLPWWDESGRLHSAPRSVTQHPSAEKGVVLQPFQYLLNLREVRAPRDLWPRFQGPSEDDLTSRAVSLTRRRVGWAELCRPAGGAVRQPDSGWRRAASPAGRCCGPGEGSRTTRSMGA